MKITKKNNALKKDKINNENIYEKKLNPTIKIIILVVLALLLVLASFYLFNLGNNVVFTETAKIDYSLNGNVDYKVQLKNNEYYKEEYLKSGMQYISSLIKSIDINFNFEGHASEKINYKYKYNVSATTLVTSKNDKSKILFENKEYIEKDKVAEVNDKSFSIDHVVSIDYNKYNDYITNYKKEYLLNSLFDLIVTIHVETIGTSEISDIPFNESTDFEVVIPLSEQVIDISLRSPKYHVSGIINGIETKTTRAKVLYGGAIILAMTSLTLLVSASIVLIKKNKEKSPYERIIDKYLKEYDRAIVITHESKINEKNFERVIGISSMQEMLDLHDNFQLPILYYEITKNKKSYFVIIKENVLYKLIVSEEKIKNNGDD